MSLQTINLSPILAEETNNSMNPVSISLNELGTNIDLKLKVENDDGYSEVYSYNELDNLDSNKILYIPSIEGTTITFIDAKYTETTNDDSVIYIVDTLQKYSSSMDKYKLDGVYQSYSIIVNPATDNQITSITLDTYINGDINLDGSLKGNDLLILKQKLLFEYSIIQTGAYEQDDEGGTLSIGGKNISYCNNLVINGNLYADNGIFLNYWSKNINGFLYTKDGNNINLTDKGVDIYLGSDSYSYKLNNDMLLTEEDIDELYFSNDVISEDSTEINESNLNIDTDRVFSNDITFNASNSMNLNASIKSEGDININGEVHNGNNSIIYSKKNISIENDSTFSYTGMIYAPNGTVTINATNVNITGCIIAKEVIIYADNINFNVNNFTKYGNSNINGILSEFQIFLADMNNDGIVDDKDLMIMKRIILGIDPDETYIPYEEWDTLEDTNDDGIPDIFEIDNWQNLNDWDEDGIPDSIESYYGTNRYIKDTDNDSLTDYEELFYTYTDPTIYDSLVEGISDGELDLDEDGLTNFKEMEYTEIYSTSLPENNPYTRLDPLNSDSDNDGLNDYYEIYKSETNPLISDTDGNGILDGDEKREQPYTQVIDNDVITEISINGSFSKDINETTSIRSIADEDMLCANVVGLVGEPFEIETTSDFDNATITFYVDITKLDVDSLDKLLLLWYDEENDNFVELNTQVNTEDNTISVTTTHFSKYMLVDKQKWFECWKNTPNYLETYEDYVPYNTSICIDCSGSMSGNDPDFIYNQMFPNLWTTYANNEYTNYRKMASERYIWSMQTEDKTEIINYSDNAYIKCNLTSCKEALIGSISTYNNGATNALDAVQQSIETLSSQDDGHNRIIILMSDGDINIDTSDNDTNGVIASCITNNIKIYTIGLGNGANNTVLENLAEKTGGEHFIAATADELFKMYNNICIEQYQSIDWADDDSDGIPDYFETQGMMCSNGQLVSTDPTDPDYDGDGLLDGEEIVVTYGQKYIQGAGNDGHSISAVYFTYKSNPEKVDSDGDGFNDIEDHYPLIVEDYDVNKHSLYLDFENQCYSCNECSIKIKTPDCQDKDVLSEDDYLMVISLKNEFINSLKKEYGDTDITLEQINFHMYNTLYYYRIDSIRNKEIYRNMYDYRDSDGRYYSEYLHNVDLDSLIKTIDDDGNVISERITSARVETVDETNFVNYVYSYIAAPTAIYLCGLVLSRSSDLFLSIIGSSVISAIPTVAAGEDINFAWTTLVMGSSIFGEEVSLVLSISDFSLNISGALNRAPYYGDKFVYICKGYQYKKTNSVSTSISVYWYRNGELLFYEEGN